MPETNVQIILNVENSSDEKLALYGKKLVKLLQSTQAQKSHYFVATLDDFLGAIYSLVLSQCNIHPFEKRHGQIEIDTVIRRAEDAAKGTLRTSGNWMAGFFFNGALFRIAASYHRGLKIIAQKETTRKWKHELLPDVEKAFPAWKHRNLDEVYDEVNDLKHTAEGKFNFREVDLEGAKAAVEELLELFEGWCGLTAPLCGTEPSKADAKPEGKLHLQGSDAE